LQDGKALSFLHVHTVGEVPKLWGELVNRPEKAEHSLVLRQAWIRQAQLRILPQILDRVRLVQS